MLRAEPTLRRTLLAWVLGPLLALLALDTLVTYSASIRFANQAYDRSLQEIAREIFLHVRDDDARLRFEMSPAAENILLVDQDDRLFYKVSAPDGRPLGGDAGIPPPPAGPLQPGKAALYDGELHGEPVRMAAIPMKMEGSGAMVLVQVAETLNKRQRLATDIHVTIFIPQLLLVILATATVYYGVRQGLHPLQLLKQAISGRSHLDLSPVEAKDVPGEVKPLVDEVNALLRRLGTTLDFQNRFIADAAHQLKTPVAGMKAQIELTLRENDATPLRRGLAQLYVSADRLSRLVAQLLSLARNEPGAVERLQLQILDLNALALEVTMEWVPEALKKGVDLGFEGAESKAMVDGDAHRLRELINNLIDNAVRYSHDGGRATVRVSAGEQILLSVSDDGPKIPVEERQRIFERFHRLLGTKTDGSGLGLAIVSEIASLHNARITLEEDADGVGNTFTVIFPPSASLPGASSL